MGLFNRKRQESADDGSSGENKKEKGGWRRPANTAFKQQRLKAWQPILTPKTVLPTLFLIGIIFGPIGGLLVWGSSLVTEITIDYTQCENIDPSSNSSLVFAEIPSNKYSYRLRSADSGATFNRPAYAYIDASSDTSRDIAERRQCIIEFDIPADLESSVFLYYKLTNFYQNHRRYVKSLNSDQLKGDFVSKSTLDDSDCKPLGSIGDKPIYPCGLIANSVFNDTYTTPLWVNDPDDTTGSGTPYEFSYTDIAWPGEKKKYVEDPVKSGAYSSYDDIVPPPNWARYNGSYSESNPPPNLKADEHFQNWMRTAGLPTFTKLYGRNDTATMRAGRYRIIVGLNFPVQPYKGTKSIVISTVSWIGGKNPFLGWAYVATAGLFVVLAIAGTARHLIKPRRLGDMSLLSWNR